MKSFLNSSARTLFSTFSVFILFSTTLFAQAPAVDSLEKNQVTVRYSDPLNDRSLIHFICSNSNGDKFQVSIIDSTGGNLFIGIYNERNFERRFAILKEQREGLHFLIKNINNNSVQTFAVKPGKVLQQIDNVSVRKIISIP